MAMRKAVSRIIPNRLSGTNEETSLFKLDFQAINEFYILLDSPHNSWLPGDEIKGQIILITKSNLANIAITLSLIGYVKINSSSRSKLRPVKHVLFDHSIEIYGDSTEMGSELVNGLSKGEHRFPFVVKLPNKRIFTSVDFGKGSITYLLKAQAKESVNELTTNNLSKTRNLKLLQNSNLISEKLINIINPIDISVLPAPRPKKLIIKVPRYNKRLQRTQSSNSTIHTSNTFSTISSNESTHTSEYNYQETQMSGTSGISQPPVGSQLEQLELDDSHDTFNDVSAQLQVPTPIPTVSPDSRVNTIKVVMSIPQSGYIRGENIPIKLKITHSRQIQDVNGIIITFVRVCRLDNGPDGSFDSFRKDLSQSVIPIYVDPITLQSEIITNVRVPADAFPTISGCPLVSFQYFIEVLINLSGKSVLLDSSLQAPLSVSNEHIDEDINPNNATLTDFQRQYNYLATTFDFNQKERVNFINTDKYKRTKKYLHLASEIIIGTHRLDINRPDVHSFSSDDQSSPVAVEIESQALESQTLESRSLEQVQNIPDYNEIDNLITHNLQLNEKDRIKAHESSLLPSAPDLGSENELESISPIDVNNDVLLEAPNSPQPGINDDTFKFDNVPMYENVNGDQVVND